MRFTYTTYNASYSDSATRRGVLRLLGSPSDETDIVSGQDYVIFWAKVGQNLNLSTPLDGVDYPPFEYLWLPPTKIDGVWTWDQGQGQTITTTFNAGVFFSISSQGATSVAVIGSYTLESSRDLSVYYAWGPQLRDSDATGNYSFTGQDLTIQVFVEAVGQEVTLSNGVMGSMVKDLEGTWVGMTLLNDQSSAQPFCLTTMDIHDGFWRGFQTHCTPTAGFPYGTFVGTFQATQGTIAFNYGFVDMGGEGDLVGLTGQTLSFDYMLSAMGSSVELTLTDPQGVKPPMMFIQMP